MQTVTGHESLPYTPPKHFYLLDTIRGLAALAVVLWHWQHFYYIGTTLPATFDRSRQPFFKLLYVFYTNGAFAVDFFFLLSGFIFFHLYMNKIARQEISAKQFTLLRFSRLYPLHFLTLIVVLIIQALTFYHTGHYNVYTENNAYHFILNLFFASSWGLEKDSSFNGPGWSVSVEVFLYALFFVVCRFKLNNRFVIGGLMLFALILQPIYSPLARGIFSFFAGGAICYAYHAILKTGTVAKYLKILRPLCIALAAIVVLDIYLEFIEKVGLQVIRPVLKNKPDEAIIKLIETLNHILVKAVVFPSIMLFLALYATIKKEAGKKLAFIGNISYSSYLLHFPLQLLIISICHQCQLNTAAFANSWLMLLAFYIILILISLLSFNYFELPMQKFIRKKVNG